MADREIVKTPDVRVRVMELEEGAATQWHHHTEVKDFFVCLKGTLQVETREPESAVVLQPGETAEVAPQVIHRVLNLLTERSEYLLVQGVGTYDFIRS
jgi:quercetin dioxygenase-like cupin family protein